MIVAVCLNVEIKSSQNFPKVTKSIYSSFLNGPTPAPFSFIIVISNTHYKFYYKYVCEKCRSSIRCRDSNSQPLEHKNSTRAPAHLQQFLVKKLSFKIGWKVIKYLGYFCTKNYSTKNFKNRPIRSHWIVGKSSRYNMSHCFYVQN